MIVYFSRKASLSRSINCQHLELNYKKITMFYLLPLIIFAAAQECPYCRWNACSLTIGSLANCSDCYLGALVNY